MSNLEMPVLSWPQRLPPGFAAALAHLPALALGLALLTSGVPLGGVSLAIGLGAALVALVWGLPMWWRVINLVFVPALWLALQAGLSPTLWLAAFFALTLTSLGAVRTRVPLYLSSQRATDELAARIPQGATCIDLGCGLGGPLARLAAARPDLRLIGVEAAPLNWLVAKLRLGRRAEIRLGSLWSSPLQACDVAYAYLSPAPMPRLWQKVQDEMRPGSLFISNTFGVPGAMPHETVELHDRSQARLLIWRL